MEDQKVGEGDPAPATVRMDVFTDVGDRLFSSRLRANLVIVCLITLAALLLMGVGRFATRQMLLDRTTAAVTTAVSAPVQFAQNAVATLVPNPTTTFVCSGGRSIVATFFGRQVRLALSDGRIIALPRTAFTGSAQYANPDSSFVFQAEGTSAFVEEREVRTYDHCTALE